MSYRLTTDSTCDLPFSFLEEHNIPCIGLGFCIGGKNYTEGADQEISREEVYTRLRNKETCTTNQINTFQFVEFIEPYVKAGEDILHIAFSSGLSGTYQSCVQGAKELSEKYPDRKIIVIDSLCASLGEGLLVYYAMKNRDGGMSLEDNAKWVEDHKLNICHWFTVDDLMFLHRGGRVSKTSAVFGSLLGIKPVLHVDDEGHLILMGKTRGRAASLEELAKKMKESAVGGIENEPVFISHGDCLEEAKQTAAFVKKHTGAQVMLFNTIGSVIGSHSGPGTMAVFFLGKQR
ncbi:MAG: DegV family protein [Acutalibacteraceae bacterium]